VVVHGRIGKSKANDAPNLNATTTYQNPVKLECLRYLIATHSNKLFVVSLDNHGGIIHTDIWATTQLQERISETFGLPRSQKACFSNGYQKTIKSRKSLAIPRRHKPSLFQTRRGCGVRVYTELVNVYSEMFESGSSS